VTLPLTTWFHDISPFALRFTQTAGVRWYGLAYVVGFIIAWWLLGLLAKRRLILISVEQVGDLMLAVIVGTIVGGRLGYVFFYRPDLLWEFRSSFPFWGVLDLMHGGMASHGGMIGIIIGCCWVARKARVPALHLMDCICAVAPFGIFFGRLANFINGELLGSIIVHPEQVAAGARTPWWGVRFPQELLERSSEARLTEDQRTALENVLIPHAGPMDPDMTNAAAVVIEKIQSGDKTLLKALEPLVSVRHPSQLYQAFAEGICLFIVLWLVWRVPRKPGVILAWFFLTYGVGRVITEFWRLPDAHLAVQRIMGLSRGQWLSVLMVVAGVAILTYVRRKPSEKIGGWGATRTNEPRA
jgi:phosphatidylglycerol:prolipoprotein diacylglycerol transferase